jgi:hypothetical protein
MPDLKNERLEVLSTCCHRALHTLARLCDHAVAARAGARDGGFILIFVFTATRADGITIIIVATAGSAAVELDTLALASNTIALASARADVGSGSAVAREGRVGWRAVGAVGQRRTTGGDWRCAEVSDELVLDVGAAEAVGKLLKFLVVVVGSIQDVLSRMGRHGLGGLDLGDWQGATLGDVNWELRAVAWGSRRSRLLVLGGVGRALAARGRLVRRWLGWGLGRRRWLGGRLGRWRAVGRRLVRVGGNVKNVQLTASGGLDGWGDAGVVGNMVTIDDIVVPVSLASLKSWVLESKGALPGARLGGGLVLGERELTDVTVPRAEKMDSLNARGDAERERKLNSRHFAFIWFNYAFELFGESMMRTMKVWSMQYCLIVGTSKWNPWFL